MTNLALDAAQCLLMGKVVSRMDSRMRNIFWEALPDNIPDLTAHLPALAAAVRDEREWHVLETLASYPLPATLSPETEHWRQGLVSVWKKQLNAARKVLGGGEWKWERKYRYISSLSALTRVDRCGMPPGMTCPSPLPTLLNEAKHVQKLLMTSTDDMDGQFECLGVLAGWHPAPNVMTASTVLKAWGDFWLELYRKDVDITWNEMDALILKGIAAKALLNLLEAGGKEQTGVPAGMGPLLLENLTMVVSVAGDIPRHNCYLDWLSWQPQDVTRFPGDTLAKFPETLLKKVKLLCQEPDRWAADIQQIVLYDALEELFRWNKSGLLTACRIDLFSRIVTDVRDYLNHCLGRNVADTDEAFPNYRLYGWLVQLVRDEVANVEGGREILQKLESHWQSECKRVHDPWGWTTRLIAWKGRIQLQRAGLATETSAVFQEELLEAIKNETSEKVQMGLFFWSLKKDTPDRVWGAWKRLWEKGLESGNGAISRTAALALLKPDPADDSVIWWQKLRDIVPLLPKNICLKLSVAEMTHLMGQLPSGSLSTESLSTGSLNAASHAISSRTWQFSPEETRFRVPTEHIAPAPMPTNVQANRPNPNRMVQRTAGSEPSPGRCHG